MTDIFRKELKKVYLNSDVYNACCNHALSTENEEIMGLLLGETDARNGISYISSYLILSRSDKKPDRVEISLEQLAAATTHAECLSKRLGTSTRVIGWYHSHPHITVWPSHVDVRTQASYQMLDSHFVGLIFSAFPNNMKSKEISNIKCNDIQLTCFQSQPDPLNPSNLNRVEIPVYIKEVALQKHNLEILCQLPVTLKKEEELLFSTNDTSSLKKDPLVTLHNQMHKLINELHITMQVAQPLHENLSSRINALKTRIAALEKEKKFLLKQDK